MLQKFHWKKREEFEGFSYLKRSNAYGEGAECSNIKYDNFILFIFIFMIIYYYCWPFTLWIHNECFFFIELSSPMYLYSQQDAFFHPSTSTNRGAYVWCVGSDSQSNSDMLSRPLISGDAHFMRYSNMW